MRFLLDDEQTEFGRTLDRMLTAAGTPAAVRAWSAGDTGPGRALWKRVADTGVFALAVPQEYEGMGSLPVELAVAFVELGRHAVPGPLVETVAAGVLLGGPAQCAGTAAADRWLPRIASGRAMVSLALPAGGPYALDMDTADVTFVVPGPGERDRTGPSCTRRPDTAPSSPHSIRPGVSRSRTSPAGSRWPRAPRSAKRPVRPPTGRPSPLRRRRWESGRRWSSGPSPMRSSARSSPPRSAPSRR